MNEPISDELLNAFADNQMDGAEKAALLERIATDDTLRAKVCETWHLKELVRSAHPLPRPEPQTRKSRPWNFLGLPLAAMLLLAAGVTSSWLAHEKYDETALPAPQLQAIRDQGNRVVLHLVSGDTERLGAALRMAEQLASTRNAEGGPMQVELITNGNGIRLMQDSGSANAVRIASLHQKYGNLRLVACNEAISRARERGMEVRLLPDVEVVPSAIQQITTRLHQGWRYLQV
jgi:intracellular sulfur oxidation DsrE/DsrF family protein